MVIKDQWIKLECIHVNQDQPGVWSVFFKRPKNFTFDAGDWIDISFGGKNYQGGITYSISSSPTERDIRITFKEGFSEIKRGLQSLTAGEAVYVTRYGNDYDFTLRQNRASVFIAGGIGIAPFRSMLKQMYDTDDKNEVHLIYTNKDDSFLFKDELDEWQTKLSGLTITYIETKTINRKKRERLLLSLIPNKHKTFYIAGPTTMVETTEHLLIDHGVSVRDIRIDSFGGY